MSKCQYCDNQAEMIPSPKEYISNKAITLFGWTLMLYKEETNTIDDMCSECLVDRQQSDEIDRISPALDDAYVKGFDDGQRTR